MSQTWAEEVAAVSSRVQLADFIDKLASRVAADHDEVESSTTDQYLEALGAWLRDSGHSAASWPLTNDPPRWSDIAAMLSAAVVYE
jgi:hypothetical protein